MKICEKGQVWVNSPAKFALSILIQKLILIFHSKILSTIRHFDNLSHSIIF